MSIIVWIIIGGLAGWAAGAVMNEDGTLLRNVAVGIVGALVGGFLMSIIGAEGFTGFNLWSFLVAFLGSIVLLAVVNLIMRGRAHA
ncbi:GlsB/YeaQ/YmgE family stress response membrane protein [Xiamenia xianingshaonis]|uniref:GlsB/YeaQ/YmgE family stress response membrane protein n=1 Tax=Xiamenia xianingshaonis TaxID=2682776 RepID=A0ABX0IKX7_9ACTN|nr:GlsB/YeaQ/YmgE family stress response membrane protein [Xiamenia xianingshaonis]NGM16774.1 GlsB/YeaQ/YmgE family stress response membrane protein [Eggerthellaceae bacterium zg-893]NHM13526.1 GlsB/YeaQ/YmgE family stress response membrane protein [Xiamenia xianingshaonis]NHM16601.1 GlsB/YeaQ/YmgE family stress response membrane protein [Xiamenia xianingshaonis]